MISRFTFLLLPACVLIAGCGDSTPTDTANQSTSSGTTSSDATSADAPSPDDPSATQDTELLAPGSVAPEVRLASVVHGQPFSGFSSDKVHVVEFWATWCGPCLNGMPHISQLQEQYGPQVQFVGVTHEDEETVADFLSGEYEEGTDWKDLLKYSIALDDNGATNAAYMQAARQNGIPCAFIVDSGTIAWIGHPANIDEPLAEVVGGRWDVAQARQNFIQQVSASKEVSEESSEMPEITLGAGIKAPDVTLAAVVQGAPVAPFERGRVYVVEFWATWCGPCLKSMPHISDLQQKYGRDVQFIGVTDEDEETVTEFLAEESPDGNTWSDVLQYSIAVDDEDRTSMDFMAAAGQDGIPCAFIVDQNGRVAWVGHPAAIDKPLADIVAGKYDIKAAAAAFQVEQALAKEDFERAMKLLDALIKHEPDNLEHQVMRLQLFHHLGDIDSYNKSTHQIVAEHPDQVVVLNTIAWFIATEQPHDKRDLDLALEACMAAYKAAADDEKAGVLDTIARVHRERGDLKAAVEWQKKAIEAAPTAPDLKASLKQYEKELAGE